MYTWIRALVLALPWCVSASADTVATPKVRLETSLGAIVLELDRDKAPQTVANFLQYMDDGFYDGTIFHRVIPGFMIQGGGFDATLQPRPSRASIRNEADNGLKNLRGTIAMARTSDPHSATAQFFINGADNAFLDHQAPSGQGWGYCVFGRVVEGMDTVDRILTTPTAARGGYRDVPQEDIVIKRVTLADG